MSPILSSGRGRVAAILLAAFAFALWLAPAAQAQPFNAWLTLQGVKVRIVDRAMRLSSLLRAESGVGETAMLS